MKKAYVDVIARFDQEGKLYPIKIRWEDGRGYQIDRILDVRPAASLKVGGAGTRYQVRIGGHITYLWLEENKWFVEAK